MGVVIIPVRGICLGCCLGRGGGSRRLPRCGLAVHLVQVIAVLAIGRLSRGTAGDIGPGLINGGGLIIPFHGGPGNLHQGLHQVPLAVGIGVIVGLHIDAVTDDVTLGVVIALGHSPGGIGENGLGHAVEEQRLQRLAVQGLVKDLGRLLHHRQVRLGTGIGGAVLGNPVGHAHAVRHGVVIPGIGSQLALFHPRPAEEEGHGLLVGHGLVRLPGDREFQVRRILGQLSPGHNRGGRSRRHPILRLHRHSRGDQRQGHHQRQKQASDSFLHLITFFLTSQFSSYAQACHPHRTRRGKRGDLNDT